MQELAQEWRTFYLSHVNPLLSYDDSMQSFIEDVTYCYERNGKNEYSLFVGSHESKDGNPHQFNFIKP